MAAKVDAILLGTRKGAIRAERRGSAYEVVDVAHEGVPVAFAARDPRTGSLWCCLDHGHWGQKLSRSRDDGKTWEEVPSPAYPEGAEIPVGFPGEGERKREPATLRYLWFFQHGGADQPGRLYLGTEPGGLFVSDDDGATWRLCEGLWNHPSRLTHWSGGGRDNAGVHSILVDPRNSRRVLVGISSGGVFETLDDGRTWTHRNRGMKNDYVPDPATNEFFHDPHFVQWCRSAPDVIWQQNHFGVFRSTDGAANWTDVSQKDGPVKFGFPVAVDERDPNTAWVVPGESDQRRVARDRALCVARTTDGGANWTVFRTGLPQKNCFDIVYRHALDVSGDSLCFGSTTGNAYVSTDRGESWTALSHHLPPVYSVRFV